jgi:hypothetical protein
MYSNTTADDAPSATGTGSDHVGSADSIPRTPEPGDGAAAGAWTPPDPPLRRRTLVPRWLPWAALALAAVVAATAGLVIWRSSTGLIALPNVEGLDVSTAAKKLSAVGMRLELGDRRFSGVVARGLIVAQDPPPGTELHSGSVVVVAVSAGSESFPMPDVIGWKLERARSGLVAKGLDVLVDVVPSQQASGTILASFPSAGVTLSTGDTVRLTVASADRSGGLLLPADLRGKTFVIDPAPMPVAGAVDPPMDVARRLRALLEASGATVAVTRDVLDTAGISVDIRAQRAKATTSTALVGLSVASGGAAGIGVLTVPPDSTTSGFFIGSAALGNAVVSSLRSVAPDVRTAPGTGDVLLVASGAPATRVVLGSVATPADARSFGDPAWADAVSQALYRALGSLYGAK